MPITNVNKQGDSSGNRTSFRPPWVKEASKDIPSSTPSWMKKKSESPSNSATPSTNSKPATTTTQSNRASTPSKTSSVTPKVQEAKKVEEPPKRAVALKSVPVKKENGQTAPAPVAAMPKEVKLQSREVKVPVMTERRPSAPQAPLKPIPKKQPTPEPSSDEEEESYEEVSEEEEEEEEKDDETLEMERLLMEAQKEAIKKQREEQRKKELEEKERANKISVKLKPVLKKTPTIEELPKDKPKSFLETPKLKKVVKGDEIPEKPAKLKLELPTLKKVVKSDSPVKLKSEPEWKADVVLQPVKNNVPPPPPPPPPGPNGGPPPPPPPPGMAVPKKEMTDKQKQTLEKLKTRPRRRPDWSEMMAEVEQGRKLKHVQCNDRSQPILTTKSMTKVDGQFIFETEKQEKSTSHNALLKEIQFGIKLKPTKTNDRSRPVLEGLRKFRRQMTIEEQILKSESRATLAMPPEEEEEDEMDDIDRLRDDLQSTKQMLALELRNKEAQERENKRLLAKIQNLEAELGREKSKSGSSGETSSVPSGSADEALVSSLKKEAEVAQKMSKDLEKKYQEIAEQLDAAKNEVEDKNRKIAALEKQLSQVSQLWDSDEEEDDGYYSKRTATKGPSYGSRRASEAPQKDSSPEPEPEVSESDEDEDEEAKTERRKRRVNREVKMMRSRLSRIKEKESVAKKEREALKFAMKTQQQIMKEEKKKYKALQKEVHKMAELMKDVEDDDEEKEEEKEKPEEEESEESEESESDEESGSDEESASESEPEDADDEKKKANLEPRVKRHEGILGALKKGNYLHQANVDRIKDEVNKQRELSVSIQRDLDSVLSELG